METTEQTDVTVLIAAAGLGTRLGLGPKALLELQGAPLITHVIGKARQISDDIVVAAPQAYLARMQPHGPECRWIVGGATRQESVARMMTMAQRNWVVLLDGARPFFSVGLMRAVLAAARESGVAGAFLYLEEPVFRIADDRIVGDILSHEARLFQTPQAYSRELLVELLERTRAQQWQEQSVMQLVIRAGWSASIRMVPGEKTNIKVITPLDWQLVQLLTDHLAG